MSFFKIDVGNVGITIAQPHRLMKWWTMNTHFARSEIQLNPLKFQEFCFNKTIPPQYFLHFFNYLSHKKESNFVCLILCVLCQKCLYAPMS